MCPDGTQNQILNMLAEAGNSQSVHELELSSDSTWLAVMYFHC